MYAVGHRLRLACRERVVRVEVLVHCSQVAAATASRALTLDQPFHCAGQLWRACENIDAWRGKRKVKDWSGKQQRGKDSSCQQTQCIDEHRGLQHSMAPATSTAHLGLQCGHSQQWRCIPAGVALCTALRVARDLTQDWCYHVSLQRTASPPPDFNQVVAGQGLVPACWVPDPTSTPAVEGTTRQPWSVFSARSVSAFNCLLVVSLRSLSMRAVWAAGRGLHVLANSQV